MKSTIWLTNINIDGRLYRPHPHANIQFITIYIGSVLWHRIIIKHCCDRLMPVTFTKHCLVFTLTAPLYIWAILGIWWKKQTGNH